MARVYMIRHGRPAAGWGDHGADPDPGLDDVGRAQAEAASRALLALPTPPTLVLTSPLRRCRETAAPFAAALGMQPVIEPRVAEIPTPKALAAADRPEWLRTAFAGTWAGIEGDLDYLAWRDAVAAAVIAHPGAAIFSHFVAINAVMSVITGDDRVIGFRPDHTSMTILAVRDGALSLVARGDEAVTGVL